MSLCEVQWLFNLNRIVFILQAGDKHESINPRVKLYVVETVNTLAVHKHLKAPSEIGRSVLQKTRQTRDVEPLLF